MPSTNGHRPERVGLLMRVSSEEQRERETIAIQSAFLQEYCRLYGLEIAGIYADDGVSGTIPLYERPEGRRLIQDAKAGKFRTVLVKKLDRLGRTLLVIVDAHDRLAEAGVALRSATEPIDTSTPSGRLIFQMLASFAEYDRENIAERTQAGLHRAYRSGQYMGVVPYGYRTDEHGRLEVVPEEAEIVREIISNVAAGSTLYREAKRLNDLGIPGPGRRYGSEARRSRGSWSVTTMSNIVRQRAYSGIHEIKINGGKDRIERAVPAVVDAALQERAKAALSEHKRYPNRKDDRNYLLSGLVKCGICGFACTGHPSLARGKRRYYYVCRDGRANYSGEDRPHKAPYVNADWLEGLVWTDVRRFLENPGEVLDRVREELSDNSDTEDLAQRREDLTKRLAGKQSEKDRYVRLYAQGHISESDLEVYLADLKNQTDNLRLLIEAVEANLSHRREQAELAETTHAWLLTLKQRLSEVEGDTQVAFSVRRQLVKLLVAGITAGRRREDGSTEVQITYRFGPSDSGSEADIFTGAVPNAVGCFNP